jgi:photosystem II stability/assembly factor-like uncharacterized protein
MKGSFDDIQWICDESKTVIALSSENAVYLSHDLGKTWQDQSLKISNAANTAATQDSSSFKIQKLVLSKADKRTVFYKSRGKTHFISRDCGKSITPVHSAGVTFDKVVMHPSVTNCLQPRFFTLY